MKGARYNAWVGVLLCLKAAGNRLSSRPLSHGAARASQREIAVALFGGARVAADWAAGDHMRKRVARLVRTGERLVAGAGPGMLRREPS